MQHRANNEQSRLPAIANRPRDIQHLVPLPITKPLVYGVLLFLVWQCGHLVAGMGLGFHYVCGRDFLYCPVLLLWGQGSAGGEGRAEERYQGADDVNYLFVRF